MKLSKITLRQELLNNLGLRYGEELDGKYTKASKMIDVVLDEMTTVIRHHLVEGDEVCLSRLCSFKPTIRKESQWFNPQLKEYVYKPQTPSIRVEVSKGLKEELVKNKER